MQAFVSLPFVRRVASRGETKTSVELASGIACDLRCVANEQFPFALHHFTGSREHNTALRRRARQRGLKMNEYGLFPEGRGESIVCAGEEELFAALGLDWIPPELRENMGEIEAAAEGRLPRLVEAADVRGMIHFHTTASDGRDSLEAMARAARERGFSYIGVCDHSRTAAYAGGLSGDALKAQRDEIERVKERVPEIDILHGVESDILADGELDYPGEVLGWLDFVVVSAHSRFTMSREEMTRRVVRAVENPHATILGHATGRLLLRREPYAIDLEAVFEAAARGGTAIEINGQPTRLDLDWRLCRAARQAGCRFAVTPDAHSTAEIEYVALSVGTARKGWLGKDDIVNCMEADAFRAWARNK
ncbi:MAG: DNA polymerase/3'-5' exonuclease PolX [candidate division BRC1 bacterium ADurb.BinA364]|nr:MAG: DNA polymerase/3'-5' exonuclease PolX [candidate division BRC1 bacterium ADurb.BinA364]